MSTRRPVPLRALALGLGGLMLAAACGGARSNGSGDGASPSPFRIAFPGVGSHGVFDASLAKDAAEARIWMAYSAVDPSVAWPSQNPDVVSTRLAYSDDAGATWADSGLVNGFEDVVLPFRAPNDAGSWTNEVATLVHDPAAPAGARWLVLWHHYLLMNGSRQFNHGWLGFKSAATPQDLAGATEVKLFAGAGYDAANDTQGGTTRSPVGGAPVIRLDALHADLAGCVFTEPGLHASAGALYLALHCRKVDGSGENPIVLLKCGGSSGPCVPTDPGGWSYLGTLLANADAAALGFDDGFSATGIFESAGGTYLVVTPVSTTPFANYYNGCRVYRFEAIDTATLAGNAGVPSPVRAVGGTAGSFNGACAYHRDGTASGAIYGELFPAEAERFRLFGSRIGL